MLLSAYIVMTLCQTCHMVRYLPGKDPALGNSMKGGSRRTLKIMMGGGACLAAWWVQLANPCAAGPWRGGALHQLPGCLPEVAQLRQQHPAAAAACQQPLPPLCWWLLPLHDSRKSETALLTQLSVA